MTLSEGSHTLRLGPDHSVVVVDADNSVVVVGADNSVVVVGADHSVVVVVRTTRGGGGCRPLDGGVLPTTVVSHMGTDDTASLSQATHEIRKQAIPQPD